VRGDVDSDHLVTILDALLTARCVLALVSCAPLNLALADLDCSGPPVNIIDALWMARRALDLITAFPC